MGREELRRVTADEALAIFTAEFDSPPLPAHVRASVVADFVRRFQATIGTAMCPGDELWHYKQLKDPVLGYQAGFALVRAGRVVLEFPYLEDN